MTLLQKEKHTRHKHKFACTHTPAHTQMHKRHLGREKHNITRIYYAKGFARRQAKQQSHLEAIKATTLDAAATVQ